ncbi:MAG: AAA family ATPase [Balneolaceae bacterium]
MKEIFEHSDQQIANVSNRFTRYLFDRIHWSSRLIGIKGARGTGKTTLLLQYLARSGKGAPNAVYLSLDDLYFATHSVVETVSNIYKEGGNIIVLDEVHKYPGWAREIKNLYDHYPQLQMIFTGSSVIDISKEEGDLSRRAVLYELNGLSYREYLHLANDILYDPVDLQMLLKDSGKIRAGFSKDFRPLQFFSDYLEHGFYPFFAEEKETFAARLKQVVRMTVEYDMTELKGFDIRNAKKLLQLLGIISNSVPFKPNISKLAAKTGIHRNSLVNYLHHLEEARLVHLLYPAGSSTSVLQKPEKLLLNNTNLSCVLSDVKPDIGNLRETFALSQLRTIHQVSYPSKGDLLVDDQLLFEIGGKNKSGKQIKDLEQAFLVLDDMEYPTAGRIPLWLFGFLY